MKKNYVRPTMVGERFVADEYVAACGDSEKIYKFECNAGNAKRGDLTSADGRINYTDNKFHSELGNSIYESYHSCSITHEASTKDTFIEGRYYQNGGRNDFRGSYQKVYIWFEQRGNNSYDIHATTNLDINTWITAKS